MNEFTEVSAENLKLIRGAKGINQDQIADILGIPISAVSKIEKKTRALASSEKALLDLFFFGTIPFDIANEKTMHGVLDFTTDQWRVIEVLARRESTTPGKWIANTIRRILSYDETAREELSRIAEERKANNAKFHVMDAPAKVAEETAPTPINKEQEA